MENENKIAFANNVEEINQTVNQLILAVKGLKNMEYVVKQGNTEDSRLLADQLLIATVMLENAYGYLFAVNKNLEE